MSQAPIAVQRSPMELATSTNSPPPPTPTGTVPAAGTTPPLHYLLPTYSSSTPTTTPSPPATGPAVVPVPTAVTVQQSDRPVASNDQKGDEMPLDEADDKAEKQQEQQQQNSTMKETLSLFADVLIVTCFVIALFVFVFRKMFTCCRHLQAAAAAEVYSVVNF